jgi:ribosomal protein L11 methyltransferase
VVAYFADRALLEADLARAVSALGVEIAPAVIPEIDWVARVREGFRPFAAGSFRITPAWDATAVPDSAPVLAEGRTERILVVEPGLAFGTGTHESTRLCLAALENRARAGPLGDVLDVGAGSGILSAAAALLGARRVIAVEIDPEALHVAVRQRELNHVPVRILRGDGARAVRADAFDLVLANISAPLLIERAPELAAAGRAQGQLVLSGLLSEDVPAVRAAYQALGSIDVRALGAWSALVVSRP